MPESYVQPVRSAGGIVLGDGGTIAMVRHVKNNLWVFPKGKLDPGESDEEAARREIAEETGLRDLERIGDLGEYRRPSLAPDGGDKPDTMKEIRMFLFAAQPYAALAPLSDKEEAAWVPFREVGEKIGSLRDRAWFAAVFERVREAIQRD